LLHEREERDDAGVFNVFNMFNTLGGLVRRGDTVLGRG
jgi:hypothetical protein